MIYIVRRGTARSWWINSTWIWHEIIKDFKSNTYWSIICDYLLKFIFILESNVINTSFDGSPDGFFTKSAFSIHTFIRITFLSINPTIIENVFKSLRRKSSIASKIIKISCAINKLLFRKQCRSRNSMSNCPMSFHGSSGGKSPTTSTLSLIFNIGYFICLPPIYGFWQSI